MKIETTKQTFLDKFHGKHLATTQDISDYLGVTERTARNYIRGMIRKSNCDAKCSKVPVETFAKWLQQKGLLVL